MIIHKFIVSSISYALHFPALNSASHSSSRTILIWPHIRRL